MPQFEARFPHCFLLKLATGGAAPRAPITFRTQTLVAGDAMISDTDAFADELWVWPMLKRTGNPFPDRLSVGRATNCDLVFRLSYVSKLHAHIYAGTSLRIVDLGSSNGTKLNGEPLRPNREAPLRPGDVLTLGALELDVLDARRLQRTLLNLVGP